ncbi:Ribonuclease T2 [Mycena chlorophos]|uniref:ribonuclease T2 n=1 Tax=Mycena chlorophos TaxID=658473 RepID=A0A8H6TH62_MYCCL|nr:Ribonuclease T2 [Mycena chlorophos]
MHFSSTGASSSASSFAPPAPGGHGGAKQTRSLKACLTCRKRKVRCMPNEQTPNAPCAQCRQRNLECEYADPNFDPHFRPMNPAAGAGSRHSPPTGPGAGSAPISRPAFASAAPVYSTFNANAQMQQQALDPMQLSQAWITQPTYPPDYYPAHTAASYGGLGAGAGAVPGYGQMPVSGDAYLGDTTTGSHAPNYSMDEYYDYGAQWPESGGQFGGDAGGQGWNTGALASGCPTNGARSCASTSAEGTCCLEGSTTGLLLQTQFWDAGSASDSTGPTNSWTIHGLWGDECNGNFIEDCDSSRDYTGISTLMTQQGGSATLSLMETFWKNLPSDGTDEELWEHEWATHGTCYSTLQVDCLPAGSPKGAEAVAFFETVVKLFQTLPTYEWLADAGITPSSSKTYTLAELNAAVENAWGFEPAFQCDGSSLDGVFYYFQLQGSVIDGTFFPRTAFTDSTCPSSGIKYTPKTGTTSVAAVEIPVETGAA